MATGIIDQAMNYLADMADTSYIKAWMNSTQTIGTSNTHTLLNLSNSQLVGSKFSFNSSQHAIIVGDNVKYVHVIASIYIGVHGTNGGKNLYIYQNNDIVARNVCNMTNDYNILKTEAYVAVNQGDKFTLDVYCIGTTTAIAADSYSTFLTVRAIG